MLICVSRIRFLYEKKSYSFNFFFVLFFSNTAFSNNQIKSYTLVCEGTILEYREGKDVSEKYFFDEFLLTINKPGLNKFINGTTFEIKANDSPEIIIELINSSQYLLRSHNHPQEIKIIYDIMDLTPFESYSMYFDNEKKLIKIIDYSHGIQKDWTGLSDKMKSLYNGDLTLSLNSGIMTQEMVYRRKFDSPVILDKVTTRCNGTQEIVKYIDHDSNGKLFDGKNPEDVVQAASGSGFFINDSGYLVTNNHVVDGCSAMKVLIDGKEYQADVVATDNTNDIALLKSEFSNKDFFKINTEDVERSESVKAIGFGFGKSYSSDIKVTAGIVSSLAGFNDNYSEFQMDAAIQSGNSGGPVINESGDVVGMSVAALNSSAVFEETGTMPQNVNYAIKASTLKQFLDANNAEYKLSEDSWFSFGSASNSEINKKIDAAAVYLSCYMTYAEIEESMNKKAMFENVE